MKLSRESPDSILRYWFGEEYYSNEKKSHLQSMLYINSRFPLWFRNSSIEFDRIQIENADLIEHLSTAYFDEEDIWSSPDGLLARIIVLDQFPRLVFRGTIKAFQTDFIAYELSKKLVNIFFSHFTAIERLFILLPFTHLEDLSAQTVGLQLGQRISEGENEEVIQFFKDMKGFPNEHYEVILRFGRFPSRNYAMNRITTEEEEIWLSSPDCPNWAKSQMKNK